jgi:hypothetical protein
VTELILKTIEGGASTARQLAGCVGIPAGDLRPVLEGLVRRGLIRELHPECRPKGCRGCPYRGKCDQMPVVGYELADDN